MKKLTFILLPLICLILSCNSEPQTESTATSSAEEANTAKEATPPAVTDPSKKPGVVELPKAFPQVYIDAGLPVWDKATVNRAHKIENDEKAKYQVILSSSEDIHAIAKYYNDAMKKSGWAAATNSAGAQSKDRRMMTFKKDKQQVIMNVLSIPNQESSIITMMFKDDLK